MVYASLIVPKNVPRSFLDQAFDAGLIDIIQPAEPYALFDRTESCACSTRDMLAICNRTITVKKDHHQASCFPYYALPEDCTFEETYVIVAWLVRHQLVSFHTSNQLHRSLKSNFWFTHHLKDCCESFTLTKDPVFMLKTIVLTPYGKDSVIEKCLLTKFNG